MEREYSDEIRVGHAAELLADADLLLKGMRERESDDYRILAGNLHTI